MGFNVEIVPMSASVQNGITCTIVNNRANRWAKFKLDGSEPASATVSQRGDSITLTMASPRVYWEQQPLGGATAIKTLGLAEMLRQAAELAQEWDRDTGRPIGEVLATEGVTK